MTSLPERNGWALRAVVVRAILAALLLVLAAFAQDAHDEPWRPQFHFTPPRNFMNDPNGLVFYKGEYHVFYQYNPQGAVWGHMSWGHAVSTDMLHWKNLPLAMPEQPDYMIYSGSAVVDWHNSSGLCRGNEKTPSCLIAIYTAAGKDQQRQNLMFSNDRGRTWTNFAGNPVADLNLPDFRDPKVFWYEPQQKWVMVAVTADEKKAVFWDSRDLEEWTPQSSFTAGNKDQGQWECPDLFELLIEGEATAKRWVLIVNRNPGAPAGGTGTEYFVGQFDGKTFVNETPEGQELWADYGKDFYATNSFSDIPASDGRRIWMGWISNWQYANREPTELWRGAQSLPRELKLRRYADGIRMVQTPIRELARLRQRQLFKIVDVPVARARESLQRAGIHSTTLEIQAELAPGTASEIGLKLRKGANEETTVGFAPQQKEAFIDRTESGLVSFSPDFPGRHKARLHVGAKIKLHIFVDRSSVETFVNEGEVVLTDRIYPSLSSDGLELYSIGDGRVLSLCVWQLASVWR